MPKVYEFPVVQSTKSVERFSRHASRPIAQEFVSFDRTRLRYLFCCQARSSYWVPSKPVYRPRSQPLSSSLIPSLLTKRQRETHGGREEPRTHRPPLSSPSPVAAHAPRNAATSSQFLFPLFSSPSTFPFLLTPYLPLGHLEFDGVALLGGGAIPDCSPEVAESV